jgi:hypothetical protein
MQVVHSDREFFFSFAQAAPENPEKAQLVSRVITSPGHAKAMLKALEDNIRVYEERFGAIPEPRGGEEAPKIQ